MLKKYRHWNSLLDRKRHKTRGKAIRRAMQRRPFFEHLEVRNLLATFAVDTFVDENDGVGVGAGTSLRDAILAANATADNDDITLPAGTYTLTIGGVTEDGALTGDLDIADSATSGTLTINGSGAASTRIDGGGGAGLGDRIFHILAGGNLSINNSKVTGGFSGEFPASGTGGGFLNEGTLSVSSSTVTQNSAYYGGGGFKNLGTLSITNSTVSQNTAYYNSGGGYGGGGGFFNGPNATLSVTDSTVSGNSANYGGGGGFYNGAGSTLNVSGSTISGNSASYGTPYGGGDYAGAGGGFKNIGTASVTNSTVSGNVATGFGNGFGGGFYNGNYNGSNGTLSVIDSIVSGNSASSFGVGVGFGGGLFNGPNGTLSVTNSNVSGNDSTSSGGGNAGGGLFNSTDGTLGVTDSTVTANTSIGGNGAGLYNQGGFYNLTGAASVTNSTISGNSASGGAGLWNGPFGKMSVSNSTISGNTASSSGGGLANDFYGTLSLTNSTVTGNTASSGGGLKNIAYFYYTTLSVANSIVAGNSASSGPDAEGDFDSHGNNLVGDPTGSTGFVAAGDMVGVNPLLGPLQDNGGPTETHELLALSPAIDAGNNTLAVDAGPDAMIGTGDDVVLVTDQRGTGFDRVVDGTVDIGAFESGAGAPTNLPPEITSDGGGATASKSIPENSTAVTDVNASDPEGDTESGGGLTYSLSGPDFALFSIDVAGNLAFMVAPDFEAPADAGANNVYDVTVTVTDTGLETDSQDIVVTVTDVDAVNEACGGILNDVIAEIDILLDDPGVTKKAKSKLVKARKDLNKAIERMCVKGDVKKGLQEIGHAVKDLLKAGKEGANVGGMIGTLVETARDIAQEAIDAAAGGNQKEIDKAEEEMVEAQDELDKVPPKPDKAIEHFAKAWAHADKAYQPLHAEGRATGPGVTQLVSHQDVLSVVDSAIAYWQGQGAAAAELHSVEIHVTQLPASYLGLASADAIWIDADAAGYGWSLNGAGGMDLLSAVTHELGHVLGFDHDKGVMGTTLDVRQRLAQPPAGQGILVNVDEPFFGMESGSLTSIAWLDPVSNRRGLDAAFDRGMAYDTLSPTLDVLAPQRRDELVVNRSLAQPLASRPRDAKLLNEGNERLLDDALLSEENLRDDEDEWSTAVDQAIAEFEKTTET